MFRSAKHAGKSHEVRYIQ